MTVSRRTVAGAIATRLTTVTNALGYYGQVGRSLTGDLIDPPGPKSPDDQRVEPYFVLYPSPGTTGPDQDLGDCAVDLMLPFQVTAAAGDIDDLLALVDRILSGLHRWTPTIAGLACGRVQFPPGFVPTNVLIDRDHTPHRLYVPLPFQLTVTA